jgi:hypothetical protein
MRKEITDLSPCDQEHTSGSNTEEMLYDRYRTKIAKAPEEKKQESRVQKISPTANEPGAAQLAQTRVKITQCVPISERIERQAKSQPTRPPEDNCESAPVRELLGFYDHGAALQINASATHAFILNFFWAL